MGFCLGSHGIMAAVAVLLMPAPGHLSPVNARGSRDGSQDRYVLPSPPEVLRPVHGPIPQGPIRIFPVAPIHICWCPLWDPTTLGRRPFPLSAVVRADVSMAVRVK